MGISINTYEPLAPRVLFGMAISILGRAGGKMEKQKCGQKDSEPGFFVGRCEEDVDCSEHLRRERFVNTLVPYAVELGDNHT